MMNASIHWEQVYAARSPEQHSWYQRKPELSLALIERCDLPSASPMIDVGGGSSTLVDHLMDLDYHSLTVLDIAPRALHHARQRLSDRAQQVKWLAADVTCFVAPRPFCLWHDRAVFHFLTDPADQSRYVSAMESSLVDGGYAIIATFAIGGPTSCSGLDIVQYDGATITQVLGERFHLLDIAGESHRTPGGAVQKFSYFRLRKC